MRRVGFTKYAPYPDFANAAKTDSKIDTLSETNNCTRSLLTCVLLFPVIWVLHVMSLKWIWFSTNWKWGAIVFLVVLFLFSYRKQTDYIRNRVEAVNSHNVKGKENKAEG